MRSPFPRLAAGLLLSLPAFAPSIFTVSTANGGGNPVSAEADFTFGANQLFVQLTNTQANPASAAQLLTGISFTFASGAFANDIGTATNLAGIARTISGSSISDA